MKKLTRKQLAAQAFEKARDYRVGKRIEAIKSGELRDYFLYFLIKKGLGSAVLNGKQMERELDEFEKTIKK